MHTPHRVITIKLSEGTQKSIKAPTGTATFSYTWNGDSWVLDYITDSTPQPRFRSRPATPKWVKYALDRGLPYTVVADDVDLGVHMSADEQLVRLLHNHTGVDSFPTGVSFRKVIGLDETRCWLFFEKSPSGDPDSVDLTPAEMNSLAQAIPFSFPRVTATRPELTTL